MIWLPTFDNEDPAVIGVRTSRVDDGHRPMEFGMSATIFRYTAEITHPAKVEMPKGAQVISVAPTRTGPEGLDIWAIVDPENDLETRQFWIVGTGHDMPETYGRFLGTIQVYGGQLIFHVFEAD